MCGERKANEKFSGKGHNAHICKACAQLTPTEQAEALTITRLHGLAARHMSDDEKKWLERRTHDERPAVKELACEIYRLRFPRAERNVRKKQLRIDSIEFLLNASIWDEYGDERSVHQKFELNRKDSALCMQHMNVEIHTEMVNLDPPDAARLFKWMLNTLEIFCWDEDYSECMVDTDPLMDSLDYFNFEDLPELPPEQEATNEGSPTWSVLLQYANGSEQRIVNYGCNLPDRVEQLYLELNQYFPDEDDDDEFNFIDAAYDCIDLLELKSLVSRMLFESDALINAALTDLLTLHMGDDMPPEPRKRPYCTYSGGSANIKFLRSFLTQQMVGEAEIAKTYKGRLVQFVDYVKDNLTAPVGALISNSALDKSLAAIEKKYKLITWLSQTSTLQIMRVRNSHKMVNSICGAAKRVSGNGDFRFELYLFHSKDDDSGHPAYIMLHEIGHALQVMLTQDPARIPESFCLMSDELLGVPIAQSPIATELFADAFAIAMIRIFGWDEYGTFDDLDEDIKIAFTYYMDRLLEKEVVSPQKQSSK